MYEYSAKVLEVIDGDTVDVEIDLGLETYRHIRLRLNGINAPELHSTDVKEREAAVKSRARLNELLSGKTVTVRTVKDRTEKYGRYLADIVIGSVEVNVQMIAEGLAKPYSGGKR